MASASLSSGSETSSKSLPVSEPSLKCSTTKQLFAPRAKPIASVSEKAVAMTFCFKHFVCKLLDKLSGFPAENKADLLHGEAVFLLRKLSPAPAAAIAHVVVKAGSVLPNITRKML